MIELSANAAFTLYLGMTLAILLGIWFMQNLKAKNKTIVPSEKELYVCEFCHFVYMENQAKSVNQCPQCHSFNRRTGEREKRRTGEGDI